MAEKGKTDEAPERPTAQGGRHWLIGLMLAFLFLFCLLALLTYDWRDISWLMTPANEPKNNMIGVAGAWGVFLGYHLAGLGIWVVPVWLGFTAVQVLAGHGRDLWWRTGWGVLFLAALCAILQLCNGVLSGVLMPLNLTGDAGGAVGDLLMTNSLEQWLSPVGGGMLAMVVLLASGVMAIGPARIAATVKSLAEARRAWQVRRAETLAHAESLQAEEERLRAEQEANKAAERGFTGRSKIPEPPENRDLEAEKKEAAAKAEEDRRAELKRRAEEARAAALTAKAAAAAEEKEKPVAVVAAIAKPAAAALSGYRLPGIELLDPIPDGDAVHGDTDQMAKLLVDTLAQFNLLVEVTHVERGPVVTRYELLPAAGIKVERIAQLANTLQMVLRANSLRIQAPVPGKNVVGVEVPNPVARKVTLREVLQGNTWASQKMEIPLALGKDVGGADMIFDLAGAPHLLVAGATGSGKSVCLNAILTGLLMSRRPDELKLLLVDPKRVEFPPYNNLPHLLVPVVTDAKKVSFALRWAIVEMDRRYKILQAARVRNIVAYNAREPVKQTELALDGLPSAASTDAGLPAKLPYIVIVIDEVADLMITVGQEIEQSITRLAQLSRAVGIHMILATQRPSVNVITGTIKANFPGRIAFQVAQKTDSRTILDQQGAETLIGRGDMLFLNPKNGRLLRAQGALVNDGEIMRVVEFVKGQIGPDFDQSFATKLDKVQESVVDEEISGSGGGGGTGGGVDSEDNADEELIQQSIQVIRDTRRASTSSLQRRLRIGYTRAARVMDILEERGIVGPPRGADPREILIDLDAEMPNNDALGPADAEPEGRASGDERLPGA
jgi:S-DNA-T family DNA segregation ATPase FtsK/SpoIIIE